MSPHAFNLEKSLGLRKSTQAIGALGKSEKSLIMRLCSCTRKISASLHKTSQVTTSFPVSRQLLLRCSTYAHPWARPCTPMAYASLPRPSDFPRFNHFFSLLLINFVFFNLPASDAIADGSKITESGQTTDLGKSSTSNRRFSELSFWGNAGLSLDSHLVSYGRDVWAAGGDWNNDAIGLYHPWVQVGVKRNKLNIFGGTWLDINNNGNDSITGDVQEADLWIGISVDLSRFDFGLSLKRWEYGGTQEIVLDSWFTFDDTGFFFKSANLNPGISLHTQLSSEQFDEKNVLVTRITPGRALSKRSQRPVWLSVPIELGFQEKGFRGNRGGHSFSSIGAQLYFPLISLPKQFGDWSVNAGLTWFDADPELLPSNPDDQFFTGKLGLLYYF